MTWLDNLFNGRIKLFPGTVTKLVDCSVPQFPNLLNGAVRVSISLGCCDGWVSWYMKSTSKHCLK